MSRPFLKNVYNTLLFTPTGTTRDASKVGRSSRSAENIAVVVQDVEEDPGAMIMILLFLLENTQHASLRFSTLLFPRQL